MTAGAAPGSRSALAAGFTVLFVGTGVNFLFGATFFTTAPLSSTVIGQLFGATHHGAIFGAANLFHHTAGALGAWTGGLVYDRTGSYRHIFLVSALVVVGSAVVSGGLARPRRR